VFARRTLTPSSKRVAKEPSRRCMDIGSLIRGRKWRTAMRSYATSSGVCSNTLSAQMTMRSPSLLQARCLGAIPAARSDSRNSVSFSLPRIGRPSVPNADKSGTTHQNQIVPFVPNQRKPRDGRDGRDGLGTA
jgi:hypothetical protein